jgi:hypothetical protein
MGGAHSELSSDLPASQVHEGWLSKESETLKAWNARFVMLANCELKWFDDENMARDGLPPRGRASLRGARVAPVSPGDGGADDAGAYADAFCIEPRGQSGARLYFQAPSASATRGWLRALQVASRETWAEPAPGSDAAAACSVCLLAHFDLLHRRHHCRRCGTLCCDGCSSHQKALPDYGYAAPVRVCTACVGEDGPVLPPAERAARAAKAAAEREKAAGLWHVQQLKQAKVDAASTAEARRAKIKEEMRIRSLRA